MDQRIEIFSTARKLVEDLKTDISKCKTREEHVRLTARANEAEILFRMLQDLVDDGK